MNTSRALFAATGLVIVLDCIHSLIARVVNFKPGQYSN